MEQYKSLINKEIDVAFGKTVINSYKITDILTTTEVCDDRGRMYRCLVDWTNKEIADSFPVLNFDARTLDELIKEGESVCPFMPSLYYKIKT